MGGRKLVKHLLLPDKLIWRGELRVLVVGDVGEPLGGTVSVRGLEGLIYDAWLLLQPEDTVTDNFI